MQQGSGLQKNATSTDAFNLDGCISCITSPVHHAQ